MSGIGDWFTWWKKEVDYGQGRQAGIPEASELRKATAVRDDKKDDWEHAIFATCVDLSTILADAKQGDLPKYSKVVHMTNSAGERNHAFSRFQNAGYTVTHHGKFGRELHISWK